MQTERFLSHNMASIEAKSPVLSPTEVTIKGLVEIENLLNELDGFTIIHPTSYNMAEDLKPLPLTEQGIVATAYMANEVVKKRITPYIITTGGWERKDQKGITVSEISARELSKLIQFMGLETSQYTLFSESFLLKYETMVPHIFHPKRCSRELSEEVNVAYDMGRALVAKNILTIVSPMHYQRALLAFNNRAQIYSQNEKYQDQLPSYNVISAWSVLMHQMGFRIEKDKVTVPEQFVSHFSDLLEMGLTEIEAISYMIENGLIFGADITNKVFELYNQEKMKIMLTQLDTLLPQLLVSTPLANKKEKSYTG